MDPPCGESPFVAQASDIRGRSVVRVHGSAGVQNLSLYEVAEMLETEQSRKCLSIEDRKLLFKLCPCLADPFDNSFGQPGHEHMSAFVLNVGGFRLGVLIHASPHPSLQASTSMKSRLEESLLQRNRDSSNIIDLIR